MEEQYFRVKRKGREVRRLRGRKRRKFKGKTGKKGRLTGEMVRKKKKGMIKG